MFFFLIEVDFYFRYNTDINKRDKKFTARCAFNQTRDKYCPVFLMRDILNEAEPDLDEQFMMLQKVTTILFYN